MQKSDPRFGGKTEQEYNAQFLNRQFHENDFVKPVIDRTISKDEDDLIREAFAKSYGVNIALIETEFKRLDDDQHPLYNDYLLYCVFIKGDYGQSGNKIKVDMNKRRVCYSILVTVPDTVKKQAAALQGNTITSGTPLQTIYIGEIPKARAPKNKRLQ